MSREKYLKILNNFKFIEGPTLVLDTRDFLFDIDQWEILVPCSTVFQETILKVQSEAQTLRPEQDCVPHRKLCVVLFEIFFRNRW